MKRLIFSLTGMFLAITSVITPISVSASVRWKVNISDLTTTSNKTLNVRYQVLSTVKEDNSYTVKLLQDGTQVGDVHNLLHPDGYGDSDTFTINFPATGTYKYQVIATNNNAGETLPSDEKTVQIVNGPEPTVTTIVVNQPAPDGGGTAGVVNATNSGGTVTATSPESATTTKNAETGDVLGSEAKAVNKSNSKRNWYVLGAFATVLLVAYYFLRIRHTAKS